ncbi:uncharacterized protein B0J16DRAFT_11207 [Fusarium flagelliforme]|uniref:uncharacterized protein n=1 Tax=Fusarium flagelliforme TaxID=2675880 RepID=UPI001E8CEA63|nr:uncharacterized protein B0J16DRAFT_11207 [Fusarium flagelliforme]KAH7197021.1 hypothetical protein B0J16DRAFT_11207 [Fusarium flagelliforme]
MSLVPTCCFIIRLATGTQSCCLYDKPSTWNEYEYPFTKLRTYRRVCMNVRTLTLSTLTEPWSQLVCLVLTDWIPKSIALIND